jgi:hypothetical protein
MMDGSCLRMKCYTKSLELTHSLTLRQRSQLCAFLLRDSSGMRLKRRLAAIAEDSDAVDADMMGSLTLTF